MDFDALRAAVVPGTGVVGRWPGVICVAECADRKVLRQLLDVCASAVGDAPGRTLARKLAAWLGGPDAPDEGLRFGTVALTTGSRGGDQWAVFLLGSVGVVVPERQVALSGAQAVAWTDRLLPKSETPVVLALEGGPIPPGVVNGVHDLRMGVVPGAGAVLVPGVEHMSGGKPAEPPARSKGEDSGWTDVVPDSTATTSRWSPPESPASRTSAAPSTTSAAALSARPAEPDGEVASRTDAERAATNGSGRAHLRPVPSVSNGSGSNGVAQREWVSRRASDTARTERTEPGTAPAAEPQQAEPGGPAGDPATPDAGGNGHANGAALGVPGAAAQAPGASTPADATGTNGTSTDAGDSGWFGATETGSTQRRHRRRRADDDATGTSGVDATPVPDLPAEEASGDGFGSGAEAPAVEPVQQVSESATEAIEGAQLGGAGSDGAALDETALRAGVDPAADGTPHLGFARTPENAEPAVAPVPVPAEPAATSMIPVDQVLETPHTSVIRAEQIMDLPPTEVRPALDSDPPTEAQRPPVGLLVFDDGVTYTVDAEYLMGRMPEADPRIGSGEMRSLPLEDTSGAVSRVHAQIMMDGWDALLVDAGSRNGTFVSPPGEQGWTQLPSGESHRLVPGTRVRIGGRSFHFESAAG